MRAISSKGGPSQGRNLASKKTAYFGDTKADEIFYTANGNHPMSLAVDGATSRENLQCAISASSLKSGNPWATIDLGAPYPVGLVRILRRSDGCGQYCKDRLHDFEIFVSNENTLAKAQAARAQTQCGGAVVRV